MVEERQLSVYRTRHSPADFAARLPLHRQGKKAERTSDIFFPLIYIQYSAGYFIALFYYIFSTLQNIRLLVLRCAEVV